MKRAHSLSKKEDFDNIFHGGRFLKGSFVALRAKKTSFNYMRLGIIVGQKISKKAVVRNKIKRQLKEVAREYIERGRSGVDIVLAPSPEIVNKKFREIKEEVEGLFKKI